MGKKEIVKKLLDYDKDMDIVVVGPDCSNSKNKLRVYALGGCIGKIATDINYTTKKKNREKSGLMDEQYCNYCSSLEPILKLKEEDKRKRTSEEIERILISEEYLKYAKEALNENQKSFKWKI